MKKKVCFKCLAEKPLYEFYKHKKMGDGHLGKCKTCTKLDSEARDKELRKDPEFVEKEKVRAREKYHRLGYKEKQKEWDKKRPWSNTVKYKNQHKKLKLKKDERAHHWSYRKEHLEDIIVMSEVDHRKLHRFIVIDSGTRFFKTLNGMFLDSKKKHLNYWNEVKHLE